MPSIIRLFVATALSATALAQNHTGTCECRRRTGHNIPNISELTDDIIVFNFVPGLGACGFTNTSDQTVSSVSSQVFNTFP